MSAETRETGGSGLTEIAVKPPANIAGLINYPGAARYVALYYVGTNPTWDDGLASATFSYFGVYSPMIEHPVLAIHLLDADLGSDDGPPTHALVIDREGEKFLVGAIDDALRLVREQFTDDDRRDAAARYEAIFERPDTLEGLRRLGMFEIFVRPSAGAQQDTAELLHHLDCQITEKLLRSYVELSKGAEAIRVYGQLHYLRGLFERARKQQGDAA